MLMITRAVVIDTLILSPRTHALIYFNFIHVVIRWPDAWLLNERWQTTIVLGVNNVPVNVDIFNSAHFYRLLV